MAKGKTNTTARKPKTTARRKPKPASVAPPVAAGPRVRVRVYRHGLGDCFLLAFPKADGGDFFVLIDCGVILGTPNPGPLMAAVAEDIVETTGGRVDVLVVTHEHWDHVSGFMQAKDAFDRLDVGRVWFAWTEDPGDETAQQLRRDRATRLAALWLGVGQMRARMAAAGGTADAPRSPSDRAHQYYSSS